MDFKKILESFDAVENETSVAASDKKAAAGSMLAILESFNRVETEETVEEAAKPDFADIDGDGDKEEPMKKAAKDKKEDEKVDEAVDEAAEEELEEAAEEELEEAIMVSAEGDEAAQLLSILQLAGMPAPAPAPVPAPMEPEMGPEMDMQDEYSNSPDEVEQDVDAVIASGDDLHSEKDQYAAAQDGDNPMKAFEGKFKAIMDELLAEDEDK